MNAKSVVCLLACAGVAGANETVIEVPQGSGVFPTVGQVDCLEEMGSGRFCAATYECADESGELWGDLANYDGRRAIGLDSPVARERDCTITVDGKAAVRWFVGFSPDGRDGELVGVTARHDAAPPVVRRVAQGGSDGSGSFLSWYVERYEIDNLHEQVKHVHCGHLVEGVHRDSCLKGEKMWMINAMLVRAVQLEATPFVKCAVETAVELQQRRWRDGDATAEQMSYAMINFLAYDIYARGLNFSYAPFGLWRVLALFTTYSNAPIWGRSFTTYNEAKYAECRALLTEQMDAEGFPSLLEHSLDGKGD